MRKSRFMTEQIIAILHEHAAGAAPAELMWRQSVSRQDVLRMEAPLFRRVRIFREADRHKLIRWAEILPLAVAA